MDSYGFLIPLMIQLEYDIQIDGSDSMAEEAVVTMYSVLEDEEVILHSFQRHLAEACIKRETREDGVECFTLFDDSVVEVSMKNDPNYVAGQVQGMLGFYAKAPLKNEELKQSILTQIRMFTCITSFHFYLTEDETRTNFIMGTLFETAEASASIVLYPSMSLFTPKGELLLSVEGESDVASWHPIAHQSILGQTLNYREEDVKRYQEISEELQELGYPHVSYMLSTQMNLDAMDVPTEKEIAMRAICLFGCAVCAEGTLMEGGSRELGLEEFSYIDEQFHCKAYLSEEEKAFITQEQEDTNVAVQFTWRYEACAVLLWALGLYDIDDSFTHLCDVGAMAEKIRTFPDFSSLCRAIQRKSDEDILQFHTRALYYDWSCVEARIHGQDLDGIEPGVVQEHHYALNWLCNANDTRDWDAITTNT